MKNNKKGYLLPMVIIYMIITMIVGAGILLLGSLDRIEATKRLHREQAFYLAEAGINYAYYRLKNNPSENLDGVQADLGNGAFQLKETTTGDTRTIYSAGTIKVGGVKDETTAETVAINVTTGGGSKIFGQGLFGTIGVIMQENAYIDSYDSRIPGSTGGGNEGNVESNTKIELDNNAEVHGAALSHGGPGTITLANQAVVTVLPLIEDTTPRILDPVPVVVPNYLLPPLLPNYPSDTTTPDYTILSGVLTVKKGHTANISGGDYRFKEINLVGGGGTTVLNFTGTVRLYVTDYLTTGNNTIINFQSPSQNELWMGDSPGGITMDNNSTMSTPTPGSALGIYVVGSAPQYLANNAQSPFYAVIYAPLATVTLLNNAALWGDIVCNEIIMEQRSIVHYNVVLHSTLPPGDPGGVSNDVSFISWTKPDWKIK